MTDPKFADVNRIRLAYVDRGQGPLVLLLHGFPDTVQTWDRLVPALIANGYRAVTVHMRGWPPSSGAKDGDYSVRQLALDALALIDVLGERKAFIIGHDWGSFAAYAAAIIAPERILGIVTEGLPPIRVYKPGFRELLHRPHHIYLRWHRLSAWLVKRRNFKLVEKLYRKWAPHMPRSSAHMNAVKTALAVKGRARSTVDYYAKPMAKADKQQFSQLITVPGLIFYGYDEPQVRRHMFQAAASSFTAKPRLVVLKNVGHWPHLEAIQKFETETIEFLDKISGT